MRHLLVFLIVIIFTDFSFSQPEEKETAWSMGWYAGYKKSFIVEASEPKHPFPAIGGWGAGYFVKYDWLNYPYKSFYVGGKISYEQKGFNSFGKRYSFRINYAIVSPAIGFRWKFIYIHGGPYYGYATKKQPSFRGC